MSINRSALLATFYMCFVQQAIAAAPTVTISSTTPSPSNIAPKMLTATFSEAVAGFTAADITVINGSLGNFVAVTKTVFTFQVTPASSMKVITISIPAGAAKNATNVSSLASNVLRLTHDATAPTVTLSTSAASPSNTNPIPVTATFSEPVGGFSVADVVVTGGNAGGLVKVSASNYNFTVTPVSPNVAISISLSAGAVQDAATNGSIASNTISITHVGFHSMTFTPDPLTVEGVYQPFRTMTFTPEALTVEGVYQPFRSMTFTPEALTVEGVYQPFRTMTFTPEALTVEGVYQSFLPMTFTPEALSVEGVYQSFRTMTFTPEALTVEGVYEPFRPITFTPDELIVEGIWNGVAGE